MTANEYIVVDCYCADCCEDVYDKGEVGETTSSWTNKELPVKGRFKTVEDALKAVCEANYFDFDIKGWLNWGENFGEDYGRFDCDFMVDNENCEANEYDKEKWKAGEKKLYACRVHVWLKVQTERDLAPTECEIA